MGEQQQKPGKYTEIEFGFELSIAIFFFGDDDGYKNLNLVIFIPNKKRFLYIPKITLAVSLLPASYQTKKNTYFEIDFKNLKFLTILLV